MILNKKRHSDRAQRVEESPDYWEFFIEWGGVSAGST